MEPPLALKGGSVFPRLPVPKEQLMLTGPGGSDVASLDKVDAVAEPSRRDKDHFGERSLRDMLTRIKNDVERVLNWMDLGLSPCACGLHVPFASPAEFPLPRPSLDKDSKVVARLKVPLGYEGSQPKLVFKPKLWKKASLKGCSCT